MIVIDTETDGFGPQAQLLELGAVGILPNGELFHERFQSYVRPVTRHPSADKAFAVNGLSYEKLADAPERAVVWHAWCLWAHRFVAAGGVPSVTAWNQPFDRDIVTRGFDGKAVPWGECLMARFKRETGKPLKVGGSLRAACAHFNVEYNEVEAHGALYDAERAALVAIQMGVMR